MVVNDFPTNAEYFRVIDGFPNYEISTDGRVRIIKTGRIMKLKCFTWLYSRWTIKR